MKGQRVSVVIPVYNRKAELLRAIDSAREQSLPPHEIIVVDDGSGFSVEEFLGRRYGELVTVIRNPQNSGGAASRNVGVRHSQGEYVAFLDSDDYWCSKKIEKQLTVFQANEAIGLVYCDQWVVSVDGCPNPSGKELIKEDLWGHLLNGWVGPNTSTLMFRRTVFLALGGFDSRLSSCQDHDLWMRVARAGIAVEYVPERLSYFSQNLSSRMSYDYHRRLKGMEYFLFKWEGAIAESRGRRHYHQFRANYITKVAFPLVVSAVRSRQLGRAFWIVMRYLLFKVPFFRRTVQAVLRGVLSKVGAKG